MLRKWIIWNLKTFKRQQITTILGLSSLPFTTLPHRKALTDKPSGIQDEEV
jgi:hypothetical protein